MSVDCCLLFVDWCAVFILDVIEVCCLLVVVGEYCLLRGDWCVLCVI